MSSGYYLPPAQHASFAVISRLISCLVTESLLRAYYIPLSGIPDTSGFAVVLSTHLISEKPIINRSLRPHDIFVIVPLLNTPVLDGTASRHGYPIGLLDPLDMVPVFYELTDKTTSDINNVRDTQLIPVSMLMFVFQRNLKRSVIDSLLPNPWELGNFRELVEITDPIYVWRKFVDGIIIQESLSETIEKELSSSYEWQSRSFSAISYISI
jgi:hypothetical protein